MFGLGVWPECSKVYLSSLYFPKSDLGESSLLHDDDGDDLFKALFFPSDLQAQEYTGLAYALLLYSS